MSLLELLMIFNPRSIRRRLSRHGRIVRDSWNHLLSRVLTLSVRNLGRDERFGLLIGSSLLSLLLLMRFMMLMMLLTPLLTLPLLLLLLSARLSIVLLLLLMLLLLLLLVLLMLTKLLPLVLLLVFKLLLFIPMLHLLFLLFSILPKLLLLVLVLLHKCLHRHLRRRSTRPGRPLPSTRSCSITTTFSGIQAVIKRLKGDSASAEAIRHRKRVRSIRRPPSGRFAGSLLLRRIRMRARKSLSTPLE